MIQGFIPDSQTKSSSIIQGKRHTCVTCGLSKCVKSPKFIPQGLGERGILIIGSSPSVSEDNTGKLWNDKYGSYIKKELRQLDIDLHRDCWSLPSLLCSSQMKGVHRNPKMPEILACRKHIFRYIEKLKPHTIILMGWSAVASVLGDTWGKGISVKDFNTWRGYCIPDQKLKAFVCPVFHPNDLELGNYIAGSVLFSNDLKRAVNTINLDFPKFNLSPKRIKILDTEKAINKLLKKLNKVSVFAWDLETTGLKPHNKKVHKIGCMSVSFKEGEAYVFSCLNLSDKSLQLLKKVMENKKIRKIAQNMKYENMWAFNIWGIKVVNWFWDTMIATHCLNNAGGVTGLKFQTYVQFGVAGYDDEVSSYLKADDANSVNKVVEAMKDPFLRVKMMTYCGYDSIFTYMLANWQIKEMGVEMSEGYSLLHDGILALANAEQQGMTVDVSYLESKLSETEKKVNKLSKKLEKSKLIRRWKHIYGNKFNLSSDTQLAHMLFEVLKLKPLKLTDSGKGSTDAEVLRLYDMEELNVLLDIRKYDKAGGTFLKSLLREQVDGIIHPFFNLHRVITYRSSSDSPNFQNLPKRDKEIKKLVRDAIIPRKGNQLVELDFSQLEVSIAASYHKDPKMLDYLVHGKDMHSDVAAQIFKIDNFDKHNPDHDILRKAAKNGFVFPQFYGDYYANNADTLCQWVSLPHTKWKRGKGVFEWLSGHLIDKGLKSFNAFVEHIKSIESDFWGNRFPVYQKWKDKLVNKYKKTGKAKLHTGFTLNAIMGKNQLINAPVQGAAFHCLLWLFIEVDRISREENWNSRLIGQIHDAIVMDVDPNELEMVLKRVKELATVTLPNEWTWINAPLKIEAEVAPVDAPWSDVEEYPL